MAPDQTRASHIVYGGRSKVSPSSRGEGRGRERTYLDVELDECTLARKRLVKHGQRGQRRRQKVLVEHDLLLVPGRVPLLGRGELLERAG